MSPLFTYRRPLFHWEFAIYDLVTRVTRITPTGDPFLPTGDPFLPTGDPFFIRNLLYTTLLRELRELRLQETPFYLQETPFSLGICYIRPCYASYASYAS